MTCSLKCTRKSKDHDDKYELSSRTTHFPDVDIIYLSTEDFLRDVRRYGKFQKFTENVFILQYCIILGSKSFPAYSMNTLKNIEFIGHTTKLNPQSKILPYLVLIYLHIRHCFLWNFAIVSFSMKIFLSLRNLLFGLQLQHVTHFIKVFLVLIEYLPRSISSTSYQ